MSHQNLSIFSVVEIEVNSLCNRKCVYCPVSILPVPQTPRYMASELFYKIVQELESIQYAGILSYHFYNEPLLRKDLTTLVNMAKEKVPGAFQLLYTNGDLLTEEKYRELLNAGINHFLVTRHDNTPIETRPCQTVQYPGQLELTNRGGAMEDVCVLDAPLYLPCYSPEDNLIITSSGDVVLCSEDALRTEIFGNLQTQSIMEVWTGVRFSDIRKKLRIGRRNTASSVCSKCSSREYSHPGGNYSKKFVR